jgi:hypothetical protein
MREEQLDYGCEFAPLEDVAAMAVDPSIVAGGAAALHAFVTGMLAYYIFNR